MAPARLAWLLRLAALCHLTLLLAGQHQGMKKCKVLCSKMTSRIPVARLLRYEQNQESCGKRAIVLETKQHKFFCADPEEKWVQEAMEHLNRDGTSENITKPVKPPTALAIAGGQSYLAVSEPKTKGAGSSLEVTSSSQEAQRPMGTSPELPVGMTGSSGTRSPPTPRAWEGKLPVGPEITEPINTAVASTVAWQSQPGPDPGDGKAPEVHSTQVLSTEPPSTQTPSMSHLTTEKNIGSEGQPTSVTGQGPSSPETSLGPEEMDPALTDTYALQDWGPGRTAQASVVPASSEGTPSGEPVASSSRISKPEERIHATMNPQTLSDPPVPDPRRQAVGLLAFLGLLFCLGVAMFAYQSLQGCPRKMAGEMAEGLRYVPRSCGSNSYVLVPV